MGGFTWQLASRLMGCHLGAWYQLLSVASQGQSTELFNRLGPVQDMIHFMTRIEDQRSYSVEFAWRVQDVERPIEIAHEVRHDFERRGQNPMYVIGECRLTPPGKSLLQPRPTALVDGDCEEHWMAWVEVLGTKAYDSDQRFLTFASEWSQRIVKEFPHALPHWGKGFDVLPSDVLRKLLVRNYASRLDIFAKERQQLDPHGLFLNSKLAALLSPTSVR